MKKSVKVAKNVTVKRGEEKKMKEKPGGSNVGKYKNVESNDFAGPAGGSPRGSYPINTRKRAHAALSYAHYAPNPEAIRRKVYAKYPDMKPSKGSDTYESK